LGSRHKLTGYAQVTGVQAGSGPQGAAGRLSAMAPSGS